MMTCLKYLLPLGGALLLLVSVWQLALFFFSSRRRHTRCLSDWSSDVCSSDPVTQKQRWQSPGGGSIGGGTVTTAGNLVIQVIPDGRLVAYSADRGEKLLDIQTGLRGGMGPPITYQLDGKQYIALMGGTGVVPPRGGFGAGPDVDNAAGRGGQREAAPAPPAPPPVMPKLLTFVLDGKASL